MVIEEVCMIAADVNLNLSVAILVNTLIPEIPTEVCSCHSTSSTAVNGRCIGVRTVCSSPTLISL